MTTISDMELQRTLGRIEAKLEELLRRANGHDEDNTARDQRITKLENWQSWVNGGLALAGILLALAYKLILK